MTVNSTSWRKFPVAHRDTSFDADDAQVRIAQWAAGSVEKYASAFLWKNPQGPPNVKNSYRLPVVDIINGKPTLIPHAVFTAAAILSGAHGGLEGVVSEEEKKSLKVVVTEIYDMLQKTYGDARVKPPWLRGGNTLEEVTASAINSDGWDAMPVAAPDAPWNALNARYKLWQWADGDIRNYRKGFLWWDKGDPENPNSYKFPIATVEDGQLKLVPRAVHGVQASLTASARDGVDIPDWDMDAVAEVAQRLAERIERGELNALTADGGPLKPPKEWFDDPGLEGPTPLAVTADGRVMGHLAAWGTCHTGLGGRCVTPPQSTMNYRLFHNGTVLTASGEEVRVGKITLGTGHAGPYLSWVAASDHYDHTGTAVAIVAAGEDQWGIWVAGSLLPDLPEEKVAELRRSPLSGDWRRFNGNLELVAALAVNTPGYPIVGLTASGEPDTVCAVGVVDTDGSIVASGEAPKLDEQTDGAVKRLERLEEFVAKLSARRRAERLRHLTGGQ